MILFLYGEDTFRSREKLKQIREKFLEKDSQGLNLTVLKEDITFSHFRDVVRQMPFLGKTRLVILENLSQAKKEEQEKIMSFLGQEHIPASTVLVFWEEGVPDARRHLFKTLVKMGKKEEFSLLSDYKREEWIKEQVRRAGGVIEKKAIAELSLRLGSNLDAIHNELEKLLAYRAKKEVRLEDIELLIKPKLETDIFKFVDALSHKEREPALKFIYDQFNLGTDKLYLASMIAYAFRNLLVIKDLEEQGLQREGIIRETHLHPFVVQKNLAASAKFSLLELKRIYEKLLDLDIKIKTGKVNPVFGLEMFIFGATA